MLEPCKNDAVSVTQSGGPFYLAFAWTREGCWALEIAPISHNSNCDVAAAAAAVVVVVMVRWLG